ncbi:MAG: mitochondrial 2-enoyl thioester reductase [Watsoniomyces obsoletus]|nr:MAG: mitochondrial 2-enoyl thioester reductase [Watsoniomyces obsoletus]
MNIIVTALVALLVTASHATQPKGLQPPPAPLRDLPWGQLNFLHSTDTHGWHAGHLQEPFYSADWGDYISFAKRMKERANEQGVDLLLIDTGDRVEGNGLYDASRPKGNYTSEIFKQQHIDVICSGNHELYKKHTADEEYLVTVPNFKGNYLASNIDIIDPGSGDLVPLAPRFRKFTTPKQGIRIVAFGFLFDFKGNYNNTVVQPVEKTIEEEWFQDAIRDEEVDLFLVVGHVAIRSREYKAIHTAIRSVKWDTPIQFFGGHTHIRDYARYDSKASALESGRYMETIGFMSIDGLTAGSSVDVTGKLEFSRRYIDNNLLSYYHHTGLNASTFHTELGRNVTRYIADARNTLQLDRVIGCAPQDYWLNRAEYPSNQSIFSWLENQVLPDITRGNATSDDDGAMQMIINTGVIRFDIFKGAFTKDTAFIVSPFTGGFKYIKGVPYEKTKQLLALLNNNGPIFQTVNELRDVDALSAQRTSRHMRSHQRQKIARGQQQQGQTILKRPHTTEKEDVNRDPKLDLYPGYTTHDDAGSDGDDTIHSSIAYYDVPSFIEAKVFSPSSSSSSSFSSTILSTPVRDNEKEPPETPETVDLIFLEFIQPYILLGLKFLGQEYDAQHDVRSFANDTSFTRLLSDWIIDHWRRDCV